MLGQLSVRLQPDGANLWLPRPVDLGFPKIRSTILGVPVIRIIVY